MKVTFELKVYTDTLMTDVQHVISTEKDYPEIDDTWTDEQIENFLDEEYEVWICTRTSGGWKL